MSNYIGIMTKRKITLILILFLLLLTGLRLMWVSRHMDPPHPHAVQGVIDLRNWDFASTRTIPLEGEWAFYPGQWLFPRNSASAGPPLQPSLLHVPGPWNSAMPNGSSYGYGTYRLRILVDQQPGFSYGLIVPIIRTSSELLVNGTSLMKLGQPAEQAERYEARTLSYATSFQTNEHEIELVLQVANYKYPPGGGILRPIRLGSAAAAEQERRQQAALQFGLSVVIALHGIYAGLLFLLNRRQKMPAYFFLLTLALMLCILIDNDKLLLQMFPAINYEWTVKIVYLSYTGTAIFILKMTEGLFPQNRKYRVFHWYYRCCFAYVLFVLLAPAKLLVECNVLFTLITTFSTIFAPVYLLRMATKQHRDAIFLLLAISSVTSSIIWGIIKNRTLLDFGFYPYDIFFAIVSFAAYWFKQYFWHAEQATRLAQELQQADKMKDEFLASTSRELRTPLHDMINIAQSVRERGQEPLAGKNDADLELLITIGHRLSFMVNELSDLVLIKENRLLLRLNELRLAPVVSGVLDMVRFMTNKPIRFEMAIPEPFPLVIADEQRVIQILFSLLRHAIKFTNEGAVTIKAEARGHTAYVYIVDTGAGLDAETLQSVFQPYEHGNAGNGKGMGPGLSLCRQLIQLQGGSLSLESQAGQGATFTFTLPLAEKTDSIAAAIPLSPQTGDGPNTFHIMEDSTTPKPGPGQDSGRFHILAVDDDPVNLSVLSALFHGEPYDIAAASSGQEAIARLTERPWDLVIANVMMPHMSGYELSKRIRERYSSFELPILLLTARSGAEDVYAGFASGANDYVAKPTDVVELKARVRALVTLRQSVSRSLRMEAAYLQAQIQPHFLFNALNSITALSSVDTDQMNELIAAFSAYLRISFDMWNLEQLVPLAYELELVRSYLFIEQARFADRLTVDWHVQADLQQLLPPLVLQPLIENAVKHGLLSRSQGGTLSIRIMEQSDVVHIAVEDDGVGMDEGRVRQLLDPAAKGRSGIGLWNTNRRLKQMYGAGLTIHSRPGEGTQVSFQFVKRQHEAKKGG
ncbi:ATP-binding protein [Paenibacillus oryzisoli]|uniref:ATP-binding protein n=1 Tax=Paenibacillus oryzisoli TaxID=1850517 RepID=UPI003D27303F